AGSRSRSRRRSGRSCCSAGSPAAAVVGDEAVGAMTEAGALHRDTSHGLVGGVLAGLGARLGVDPVILRIAFVVVAIATGGLALLAYLVAWAALPAANGEAAPIARLLRVSPVRGDWRVAVGVGLLTLSALLAFRELHVWW